VREVVDIYEAWEGKEAAPMKVKELMMVLQIEVSRLYKLDDRPQESENPKNRQLKDTRLG
jgi:hypothetical protein